MAKTLDSLNNSQCQFLDMCVTCFGIDKIAAQVINDVLVTIVIVLYQNHGNSAKCGSQVEGIVAMIIEWTQKRSIDKKCIQCVKILLSILIPEEWDTLL